ncbi:MAG TPA: sugar kinase, partial [Bacteroidetes bacterium]|nr:sugar kinase [Bacteroidota bacterium]
YSPDFSERETLYTHLNVFEQFNPVIPDSLRETPFVFLANIGPELQLHVLDQMKKPEFVAMDTMNFWIERSYYAVREVIARVDGLIINDEEARMITGQKNLIRAMEEIKEWGPKVLIVKKGEHGAVLLLDDGFFYLPAYPVRDIVDPTGAGDTFAGGFMGYLASADEITPATVRAATVAASALASFNVEGFGVEKLKEISDENIRQRVEEFQKMTCLALDR